ncbi:MAG: lipoate--protein ligase family protein [Acidithiobacillus sp.]
MSDRHIGVSWSVLDTGLRDADHNMALDRAFLDAVAAGDWGPTLRFLRFQDSALLGHHQSPRQELDLDYCASEGIQVQRRLTGGGAIVFDPSQIGWELICLRCHLPQGDMTALSREICEAAAAGLRHLGVHAVYRPRNDIEVDGRKISGTGGVLEGEALLFQGTVLIDLDIPRMLRILRVPVEKLDAHAIRSVAERVTSLRALLPELPSMTAVQEALVRGFREHFGGQWEWPAAVAVPESVTRRLPQALAEVRDPDWLGLQDRPQEEQPLRQAVLRTSGGTLRAVVLWDERGQRLKQVQFSGDIFVQPSRALVDLEARLRNSHIDELDALVSRWFTNDVVDAFGMQPEHFVAVLQQAVEDAHAPCL